MNDFYSILLITKTAAWQELWVILSALLKVRMSVLFVYRKDYMLYISRKEHFNAAHKLYNPDWTREKNIEVFGPCASDKSLVWASEVSDRRDTRLLQDLHSCIIFFQPIVAGSTASLAYNYMLLFNLPEMVYTGLLGGESPEKIDKVHRLFFYPIYPNLCLVCDSLCQKCIFRTLCGYSDI